MMFVVERTSEVSEEEQPCAEAHRETGRLPNGEPKPIWVVEIPTMDGLLAFSDKYGPLIVSRSLEVVGYGDIEIYDDRRE